MMQPCPSGSTLIGIQVDLGDARTARLRVRGERIQAIRSGARGRRQGLPRVAPSSAAAPVAAIIASASPSRSGSDRKAKSRFISMSVPPAPNARNSPKSGSRTMPAKTSTPSRTNSCTRKPLSRLPHPCCIDPSAKLLPGLAQHCIASRCRAPPGRVRSCAGSRPPLLSAPRDSRSPPLRAEASRRGRDEMLA